MEKENIRCRWSDQKEAERVAIGEGSGGQKGNHLLKFRCQKDATEEYLYRGKFEDLSGYEEPGVFFIKDEIIPSKTKADLLACYKISKYVLNTNVISLRGFGLDEISKTDIFVAYDPFDHTFPFWSGLYPQLLTPAWWVESIRAILESMHSMFLLQILHGELHNPHSYVIVSGSLKLINFGIKVDATKEEEKKISYSEASSSSRSRTDVGELGRMDLLHLLYFLTHKTDTDRVFSNDPLWNHFKKCFYSLTIAQLRKHPFLLGELERFKYCRDITDTVRNRMSGNITDFEKLLNKEGDAFGFWNPTGDAVFERIFSSGSWIPFQDRTPYKLFQFMGTVLDHYEEKASEVNVTVANRYDGISKFLNKYPLFLAVLHVVLVYIPNIFSITDFDLARRAVSKTIEQEED